MKRALVVGSQIEGLRGVEGDTVLMEEMLVARGFQVDRRIRDHATRAGILAGYDALIEASQEGDVAVVYYGGHGFHAALESEQLRSWQCIAPTDLRKSGVDDWRGITAWELSIKQAQLTARTKNVTVILDCCSASQMSRNAEVQHATARALPHPLHTRIEHHVAALRAQYGAAFDAVAATGSPDAVRLVACGETESAFEAPDAAGAVHGVFTAALLHVLREVGDTPISWSAIIDAIRARVVRRFIHQRPEVEGPKRRQLFSLVEDDERGHVAISATGYGFLLPVGRLTGVTKGDVYGIMRVGAKTYDSRAALAQVEVTEVMALTSKAQWKQGMPGMLAMPGMQGEQELPVDAVAFPITRNAVRRAVALDVPEAERGRIEKAIAAVPTLRVATADESGVVATLKLAQDELTIEDAGGPMFPAARFPGELDGTIKNLANLGVAQGIRELEGEHGVFPHELAIELGTIDRGDARPLPAHGAALGLRDRIYVKVTSKAYRRLYVHVFNVGVRGKVTLLSGLAPSGVALDGGDPPFVLGRGANGAFTGLDLCWPEGLPKSSSPRTDELVVIATTAKTSLKTLETQEFLGGTRSPGSKLSDLLGQLQDGITRDVGDGPPIDAFLVQRLSYELHPRDAALAGVMFELDAKAGGHAETHDSGAGIPPDTRAASKVPTAPALAVADVPHAISIQLANPSVEEQDRQKP